ncbi:MAG: hypothetical protein JSS36_12010 [Proteobacteria bacterium]|nr:hypothetical protein [Pseudomonadota bacterium]
MNLRLPLVLLLATAALAGCRTKGELVLDNGIGVSAVRNACPAVGIPDYTGNITMFTQPGVTDARAIDVVASMTQVRADCDPKASARVHSGVRFVVQARRADTHGARRVVLPYFVTVLRGGTAVVAKRIGQVTLDFADGQARAEVSGSGGATIDKGEASLPRDIAERITRRRQAGDADAASDPMADPEVKAALNRAHFELLVGFQLTDQQLQYNATR